MAFTMTVKLTGAAFTDEDTGEFQPNAELARILRKVADSVEEWQYPSSDAITDVYGNVVGSYDTVED